MRVLGASVDAGIRYHSEAIGLEPSNPVLRYLFALGLIALDDPTLWDDAVQQIRIALNLEASDAFEEGVRAEMQRLEALLHDRRRAVEWANQRLME